MNVFRQDKMIKDVVKLFFYGGMLDNKTIKVYTGKNSLSNKQKKFIENQLS